MQTFNLNTHRNQSATSLPRLVFPVCPLELDIYMMLSSVINIDLYLLAPVLYSVSVKKNINFVYLMRFYITFVCLHQE